MADVLKAPVEYRPAVWRGEPMPGYAVGSDGSVLSYWRRVPSGDGRFVWRVTEQSRPLKPYKAGSDMAHLSVALRSGGKTTRCYVHALVMEAFVGPRPLGLEVCHNDGNGRNNAVANLRYDTPKANEADKFLHGTHQWGQRNPSAKLTDGEAEEMRRRRAAGEKLKDLAARFGVRESTVSRICNFIRRGR